MSDWHKGMSPFPGLSRFTYTQRKIYFGREKQVERALTALAEPDTRALVVAGPSGTGKSSLVFAGILPRLLSHAPSAKAALQIIKVRPADNESLFQSLAQALRDRTRWHGSALPSLAKQWQLHPDVLVNELARLTLPLRAIVIDQAEELFDPIRDDELKAFIDLLTNIRASDGKPVPLLISIRADFLVRFQELATDCTALEDNKILMLASLRRNQIRVMIKKPAEAAALNVDEVLDRLVDEVHNGDTSTTLPMLAATLERLYKKKNKNDNTLTVKALDEMGGVGGVIANIAEEAYTSCINEFGETETNDVFKVVFSELFRFEAIELSPIRLSASIDALNKKHRHAKRLIDIFADEQIRLLSKARIGDKRPATKAQVDVAHETIFSAWPRLKHLIDQTKNEHLELEHARISAHHWAERGRSAWQIHAVRLRDSQNALRSLGRTRDWTNDKNTKDFVFPRNVLIARLELPTREVSNEERARIGDLLNVAEQAWADVGDTRPGVSVFNGGDFPADYWCKSEGVALGRYPVTQMQYRAFAGSDEFGKPQYWPPMVAPPERPRFDKARDNHPATKISWLEACAYCRWLTGISQRTGAIARHQNIRLPTSSEWRNGLLLHADDWDTVSRWPGNTTKAELDRTIAVGLWPTVRTHCGAEDMIGNVWEYCADKIADGQTVWDNSTELRAAMGGSWFESPRIGPEKLMNRSGPNGRSTSVGFRLCFD